MFETAAAGGRLQMSAMLNAAVVCCCCGSTTGGRRAARRAHGRPCSGCLSHSARCSARAHDAGWPRGGRARGCQARLGRAGAQSGTAPAPPFPPPLLRAHPPCSPSCTPWLPSGAPSPAPRPLQPPSFWQAQRGSPAGGGRGVGAVQEGSRGGKAAPLPAVRAATHLELPAAARLGQPLALAPRQRLLVDRELDGVGGGACAQVVPGRGGGRGRGWARPRGMPGWRAGPGRPGALQPPHMPVLRPFFQA